MKIVHVVEAFGGGIVEFIASLANGIPEYHHIIIFNEREININLIKSRFNDAKTEFIPWKNAQREIKLHKDFKSLLELRAILKLLNPNIIHLHSSKAGFIGRLWGFGNKENGSKIIYTPNGLSFARKDISVLNSIIFKTLEYIASKLSGEIVCVSSSESKLLEKIGVESTFINNGIWTKNHQSPELSNSSDAITIVTSGRICYQKNPKSFNDIASYFRNNPKIAFVWIGDGELKHLLASPNIKITGWLPKPNVIDMLKGSQIYLSTALWEGLPFSVLEAMDCRLCLVLSQCVGNEDLVREDENGHLFKEWQSAVAFINKLIAKPFLINRLGHNSYDMLTSEFNAEDMVMKYKLLYQKTYK